MRLSVTSPPGRRGTKPPASLRGTMENASTGQMCSSNPPPGCGGGCAGARRPRPGARPHGKAQSVFWFNKNCAVPFVQNNLTEYPAGLPPGGGRRGRRPGRPVGHDLAGPWVDVPDQPAPAVARLLPLWVPPRLGLVHVHGARAPVGLPYQGYPCLPPSRNNVIHYDT